MTARKKLTAEELDELAERTPNTLNPIEYGRLIAAASLGIQLEFETNRGYPPPASRAVADNEMVRLLLHKQRREGEEIAIWKRKAAERSAKLREAQTTIARLLTEARKE